MQRGEIPGLAGVHMFGFAAYFQMIVYGSQE